MIHVRIVTGTRKLDEAQARIVRQKLDEELASIPQGEWLFIFVGEALGVDTETETWADEMQLDGRKVALRRISAKWTMFRDLGNVGIAGPLRNEELVQSAMVYVRYCKSAKCLAFPVSSSRGTLDMMKRTTPLMETVVQWLDQ